MRNHLQPLTSDVYVSEIGRMVCILFFTLVARCDQLSELTHTHTKSSFVWGYCSELKWVEKLEFIRFFCRMQSVADIDFIYLSVFLLV